VQPDVLLMDEPCSALDPISTLAIEDLINELKNEYTIVIVTHNMQQAARVSDFTGHAAVPRRVHEHAEHVPVQAVHGVVVTRELHREQHVAGARDLGGLAR